MVITSNATGSAECFTYGLKPDCAVYDVSKPGVEGLDFSRIDSVIEFKCESDPFVDDSNPENHSSDSTDDQEFNPFLCPPGPRRDCLGQLVAYAPR
jgi:hypothetical protein